jgi:hypothetical protein
LFQNLSNRYSRDEITDEEDKVIILKILKKQSAPTSQKKTRGGSISPWAENLGIERFFDMMTPRLIDGYKLKRLRENQES